MKRFFRRHLALILLLGSFVVLAVAYSLANPLYEATDELRHARFVRHIVVYHNLPEQRLEGPRAQSHHPPLYYALGALVSFWVPVEQEVYYEPPINPFWAYRYWEVGRDNKNQYLHGADELFPFRGIALAVYLMRWYSVLLGAGVVWLTWRLGREVWPDRPALALGGAALVAFNPQFLYLSGAVGNDVAAGLAGVAVLLASVRLVSRVGLAQNQKPHHGDAEGTEFTQGFSVFSPCLRGKSDRQAVGLGVLFGLALMVKFNLAALLGIIELALLVAAFGRRDWRAFIRANLILFLATAVIAGWWFVRNQILYGEPTGFERVTELWGVRDPGESWGLAVSELPYLWTSLWGRFGYGQVPLPDWFYQLLACTAGLAVVGWMIRLVRARKTLAHWPISSLAHWPILLLAAMVLLFFTVVFSYLLVSPAGPMGRFFFPALPALGLLVFAGMTGWIPQRWEKGLAIVLNLGLAVLACWALVGALRPAFARPARLSAEQAAAIPNPLDVQLGDVARLRGYQVRPTTAYPGESVDVTLYWETLRPAEENYVVFVHFIDELGVVVAQRDTHPGLGNYITSAWTAGVLFADTYRVIVPETAYTPNVARAQVGLYLPETGRLLAADGRDAIQLTEVEIAVRPDSQFPNQMWVNVDNKAALVGYELDRRLVRPGQTIHLTLYWRSLQQMEENYSVFVQALDPPDQVVGKGGSWPDGGQAPTVTWRPGEIVQDAQEVTIVEDARPGMYELVVGLVGSEGHLPIVAEDGHWLDHRIWLGRVRVWLGQETGHSE